MAGSMREAFAKAGVQTKSKPTPVRSRQPTSHRGQTMPPKLPTSYFGVDEAESSYLLTDFVSREKLEPYVRAFANGHPSLTTGQMRRFFNHCRGIERELKAEGKSWQQVSAKFASLSPHAHSAAAANKIPPLFRGFIDDNVKRVLSSTDPCQAFLAGFLRHFEALVGFGAKFLKKGP